MKFLLCQLLLLLTSPAFCQEANLYFNSGSIRPNDLVKLEQIVDQYHNQKFHILLVGYADTVGTDTYNFDLSKRRAASVREFFISKHVNPEDVRSEFYGEIRSGREEQAFDRRVEIYLVNTDDKELKTYEDFVRSVQPTPQYFPVSSNEVSVIEGKKGTLVYIPENSFHYSDGSPVSGDINIQMTEYYNLSEFIAAHLSTVSDGEVLISGGMINIKAFKDSSQVFLNKGKEMQLAFPRTFNGSFETFFGEMLPDSTMNWKPKIERPKLPLFDHPDSLGVYVTQDWQLGITDRSTSVEKMKKTIFDFYTDRFVELTQEQLENLEKYRNDMDWSLYYQKNFSTLTTDRLEWINCDRFLNDSSSKQVDYYVKTTDPKVQIKNVFLVYRDLKSIIEFSRREDKFQLRANLPMARPTWILATGFVNDKFYMCFKPVKPADKKTEVIELKEQPVSGLKDAIKGFLKG
jgi:hypothetical protein